MPSRPSSFLFPFKQNGTQEPSPALSSPQQPSQHGIILPLVLLGLQCDVVVHVLPPAVPDCHGDTEQDQDDAAGASDCHRQDADL